MHLAWSGEDALVVGVDVVDGEEDGLAAAPKDLAEELARVKRVVNVTVSSRRMPPRSRTSLRVNILGEPRGRWA